MAKRDIFDSPIYKILNYIYWFAAANVLFMLINILLLLILLIPVKSIDFTFSVIIYIVSIPFGPSITALMFVMGKIIREGDIDVTRDFFKAFKQSFKQSLKVWILELSSVMVLIVDINYFNRGSVKIVVPFFYVLIIIVLILGLYAFPIISRFYLKTLDVLKLSFYYSIRKFHITLLNTAAVIGVTYVMVKFPAFLVFFFASIVSYLIMYYERNVMKDIEDRINNKN